MRVLAQSLRLLRPFWRLAAFAAACGVVSGIATAVLLSRINAALNAPDFDAAGMLGPIAGLALLALASQIGVNIGNSLVGQSVIAALRRELSAKILAAPIALLERLRAHRLLTTLNQDIHVVTAFAFNFSSWVIALAITAGGFAYLATLSPVLFAGTLVAVAALGAAQAVAHRIGVGRFDAARAAEDDLQKHYLAMIAGAKELRLNRARRARLFARDLALTIDRIRERFLAAVRVFYALKAGSSALFF